MKIFFDDGIEQTWNKFILKMEILEFFDRLI